MAQELQELKGVKPIVDTLVDLLEVHLASFESNLPLDAEKPWVAEGRDMSVNDLFSDDNADRVWTEINYALNMRFDSDTALHENDEMGSVEQQDKIARLEGEVEELREDAADKDQKYKEKAEQSRNTINQLSLAIRNLVFDALTKHHTLVGALTPVVQFLYRCEFGRPSVKELLLGYTKAREQLLLLAKQYRFKDVHDTVTPLPDSCTTYVEATLFAYNLAQATTSTSGNANFSDIFEKTVEENIRSLDSAKPVIRECWATNKKGRKIVLTNIARVVEAHRRRPELRDWNDDIIQDRDNWPQPTLPRSLEETLTQAQKIRDMDLTPFKDPNDETAMVYKRADGYPVKRFRSKTIATDTDETLREYQKEFNNTRPQDAKSTNMKEPASKN
jgi:hypothetical protein